MKSFIVKTICLLVLVFSLVFTTSCTEKETLLFLNWGEYINEDLVTKFEEEYNCNVIVDLTDSNELFYAKLKSGTTAYDLTCPGDYMIQKMVDNDLLQKFDFSKIPNYKMEYFISTLQDVMIQLDADDPSREVNDYYAPYFWGSFGIMYNKNFTGIEDVLDGLMNDPNADIWDAFFEDDVLGTNCRKGMYNVARFIYAAAMLYAGEDPNAFSQELLDKFSAIINGATYARWEIDNLKHAVAAGNSDFSFVYTGDCLDMINVKREDGVGLDDVTFDIAIPKNTILHMDCLVIPKNARHVDLAHKFINFMLDPENCFENATVVGYCTPLQRTYEMIVNKEKMPENPTEEEFFYYDNFARTVAKYYPCDPVTGKMLISGKVLSYFSKEQLTACENIITAAKANQR